MIEDQTGMRVLEHFNNLARSVNAAYDAVNERRDSVENVRARVVTMRAELDAIETHLVNDAVLKSVPN